MLDRNVLRLGLCNGRGDGPCPNRIILLLCEGVRHLAPYSAGGPYNTAQAFQRLVDLCPTHDDAGCQVAEGRLCPFGTGEPVHDGVRRASIVKSHGPAEEPLLSDVELEASASRYGLTEQEIEIIRLMIADEKDTTIARRLGIKACTVHTHFDHLFKKLDVSSRTQVVVLLFHDYKARVGKL